ISERIELLKPEPHIKRVIEVAIFEFAVAKFGGVVPVAGGVPDQHAKVLANGEKAHIGSDDGKAALLAIGGGGRIHNPQFENVPVMGSPWNIHSHQGDG